MSGAPKSFMAKPHAKGKCAFGSVDESERARKRYEEACRAACDQVRGSLSGGFAIAIEDARFSDSNGACNEVDAERYDAHPKRCVGRARKRGNMRID